MADVIGGRWEDVTSCCQRIYANLTSACSLTSTAVFGELLWLLFSYFLSDYLVCVGRFGLSGWRQRSRSDSGLSSGEDQPAKNIFFLQTDVCTKLNNKTNVNTVYNR